MTELGKRKLPFGHYKVIFNNALKSDETEMECKPLTQEEYTDGWNTVLPRIRKHTPIHHWSVTLAQLPPHLWSKHKLSYEGGKAFYPVIRDNIYYYSINETAHDKDLKILYEELSKGFYADKTIIKELLGKLEGQINSWLILRAKKFMKCIREDRYYADLLNL